MSVAPTAFEAQIKPVLSALKMAQRQEEQIAPQPAIATAPFITISRQPGILTDGLVGCLTKRLNSNASGWKVWDRELVEKVAADHHISRELVDALGQSGRGWLEEFVRGLSISAGPPEELAVYRRVATTIRALAQGGNAIIIGRGAVHITANIKGGVHVRVVAPWGYRVWRLAAELNISRDEAAARIKELEHEREIFYRRYWQHQPPTPELFSITLNATAADEERLAECVLPLLKAHGVHCQCDVPGCMALQI